MQYLTRLGLRLAAVALATVCILPGSAKAGALLDAIKARGVLVCGVSQDSPGNAMVNSQGRMVGFHAEICRAIAAALFGDPDKVKFVPLTSMVRFTAVQTGEVDVWESTTALTLVRDSTLGLTIPVATMYTGQGFLVNKRTHAKSAADLNGATICSTQGTEIDRNVVDYTTKAGIHMQTIGFEASSTLLSAFFAGRCDAVSNDMVSLASNLATAANRDDFELLPDLISKEPHGPVVRSDDLQWATLVRWVVFALIQAEEFGLTKDNVQKAYDASPDPRLQRFLGKAGTAGAGFGLRNGWAYDVIRTVGNYGEIYERNLGAGGLKLDRGHNRLWTDGGMMGSPLCPRRARFPAAPGWTRPCSNPTASCFRRGFSPAGDRRGAPRGHRRGWNRGRRRRHPSAAPSSAPRPPRRFASPPPVPWRRRL
jgi:general L-amino acid transport system substrate-binding protein